jgi:hypothetical protein
MDAGGRATQDAKAEAGIQRQIYDGPVIKNESLLSHTGEVAGVGAGLPANKRDNTGEDPVRGQARSYNQLQSNLTRYKEESVGAHFFLIYAVNVL